MTSFQVPTYTPPASGWQLVDYKPRVILTAKADSTGTATATGDPVEPGYMWSIQRAVASSTSSAVTSCRIYDGSVSAANLMTGTNSGDYDEADYPAGLLVQGGLSVSGVWTGCNPGDVCTLRLQVAVLQQVG